MVLGRLLKPAEIKVFRARVGLTQAELARMAGVTQAYIAKIEAGTADPKASTLERITRALESVSSKRVLPTVEKIMSAPVISVKPTDSVARAVALMEKHNISQLPVIREKTNEGSISESCILRHLGSGKNFGTLLKHKISEVMEEPFPTVSREESIEVVYPLLEQKPAVVVCDRGRIVGIVTKADLFKLRRAG